MKICWDNIKDLKLTKFGNFRKGTTTYYYFEMCMECSEPYLGLKNHKHCSKSCINIGSNGSLYGMCGKDHPMYGRTGKSHPNWKGGYRTNNIPSYDTFVHQLEPYEQCRRNIIDPNILEVKCTYCGKWYTPTRREVRSRIDGINADICRFYCSDNCKMVCPLYGKSPLSLIKRDKIAAGYILPEELNRETQPQLRKIVLARDNYTCQKCSSDGPLHCHHVEPVKLNPIESADLDNCITLCVGCHRKIHELPGCNYGELKECINWP